MWNQFDLNVLVKGSRCKQYDHDGRKYIEAKDGSEWYLNIQNNYHNRILAVVSVDSLNVLTGETASSNDSGYIIEPYHSQKIKGFRFSDNEWALFRFGYKMKGKTYAHSKGDGSEKNCGVIGVKLFYENPPVVVYNPPPIPHWYGFAMTGSCNAGTSWSSGVGTYRSSGPAATTLSSTPDYVEYSQEVKCSARQSTVKKLSFDMGTEAGRREESRVEEVEFQRGCQALATDIYYASRQSLIEMGVPMSTHLKVNKLPQSFPNKYCTMPKDWSGY